MAGKCKIYTTGLETKAVLVSSPVVYDFTLSSHVADTANHSLSLLKMVTDTQSDRNLVQWRVCLIFIISDISIMPTHIVIDDEDLEWLEEFGGLEAETVKTRETNYNWFVKYVESDGFQLEELFSSEDGRDKFCDLFSRFFFSLRVKSKDDGTEKLPKKAYAEKIKSNIKIKIGDEHKVDVYDPVLFLPWISNCFFGYMYTHTLTHMHRHTTQYVLKGRAPREASTSVHSHTLTHTCTVTQHSTS